MNIEFDPTNSKIIITDLSFELIGFLNLSSFNAYQVNNASVLSAINSRLNILETNSHIHTPSPSPSPTPIVTKIRINTGGSTYTDSLGNVWSADQYFTGGQSYTPSQDAGAPLATNTDDPLLFDTERSGEAFFYDIPVLTNGTWEIKLYRCEHYHTTSNSRKSNLSVNNVVKETGFDLFVQAGGKDKALITTYQGITTNNFIKLDFTGQVGDPLINAIELSWLNDSTTLPDTSVIAVIDQEYTFYNGAKYTFGVNHVKLVNVDNFIVYDGVSGQIEVKVNLSLGIAEYGNDNQYSFLGFNPPGYWENSTRRLLTLTEYQNF